MSFFHRLVKDSTKRLVTLWAAMILGIGTLGIAFAIVYIVVTRQEVDWTGMSLCISAICVPLAGLAGWNYQKKDNPIPPEGSN